MSNQAAHAPLLVVLKNEAHDASIYIVHSGIETSDGLLKLDSAESYETAIKLQSAASVEETDAAYETLALLNSKDRPSPLTENAVRSLFRTGFGLGADEWVSYAGPKALTGSLLVFVFRDLTGCAFSVFVHNGASGVSGMVAKALDLDSSPELDSTSFEEAVSFAAKTATGVNSSVFTATEPWAAVDFRMQQAENCRQVTFSSRPTNQTHLESLRTSFETGGPRRLDEWDWH